MEHHHVSWENSLSMAIFNDYVSHYQRVMGKSVLQLASAARRWVLVCRAMSFQRQRGHSNCRGKHTWPGHVRAPSMANLLFGYSIHVYIYIYMSHVHISYIHIYAYMFYLYIYIYIHMYVYVYIHIWTQDRQLK